MTIKSSLISLSEAIDNGHKLGKGQKVKLPIFPEAYIYGFVTASSQCLDDYIDMPCLGTVNVVSNRAVNIIDGKIFRFPIFQSVKKATDERYELRYLYVPRFLHLPYESHVRAYRDTVRYENPSGNVWKLENVKVIDNVAYYYPKNDDLYFESSSKWQGISTGFGVIVRRVAKTSDQLIYEVYNPEEVMMEIE